LSLKLLSSSDMNEVDRLNTCYKFCQLVIWTLYLSAFCLTVTMQGQMATVHRFIFPASSGKLATMYVWSSWGWRHLVHRGSLYGNCRNYILSDVLS
jgi:hypothetical protein